MKRIIPYLTVLLGILLNACWPYKEDKNLLDQESKDYCLFGERSYWIYQDSVTSVIDSLIIEHSVEYQYITVSEEYNFHRTWEEYRTRISSYSIDSTYNFWAILSSENGGSSFRSSFADYHNGSFGETSMGVCALIKKINSITIDDNTFKDVKIFELNYYVYRPQYKRYKEIYYWAKHIGLIRKEKYEDNDDYIYNLISIHNLIRYNIKPYNDNK